MSTLERKKDFKKTIGAEDLRKRREEVTVELRKGRRDDGVARKRHDTRGGFGEADGVNDSDRMDDGASGSGSQQLGGGQTGSGGRVSHSPVYLEGMQARIDNVSSDVAALTHPEESVRLEATVRLRKLLSIERNPPIHELIRAGAVPKLAMLLHGHASPALQFEAAWALTNIASGTSEHTRVVCDLGAVPALVRLIDSPHSDVREQAVWALGNIAGDSAKCRDLVLSYGAVEPLAAALLNPATRPAMMRNATWAVSNLCRGKPPPRPPLLAAALPALAMLLWAQDEEALADTCWAYAYLSDSLHPGPGGSLGALLVSPTPQQPLPGKFLPGVPGPSVSAAGPSLMSSLASGLGGMGADACLHRELSTGGGPVGGGYSGTFTADGGMIMDEGGQGGRSSGGLSGPPAGPAGCVGRNDRGDGNGDDQHGGGLSDPAAAHATATAALRVTFELLRQTQQPDWSSQAAAGMAYAALAAEGVTPRLICLLAHPSGVQTPVLRVLGNMAAGERAQSELIVRAGGIQALGQLLTASADRRGLPKEICWILSNLTASASPPDVLALAQCGAAATLADLITGSTAPFELRREAGWALTNAAIAADVTATAALVAGGSLPAALVAVLQIPDAELVSVALAALQTLLAHGAALALQSGSALAGSNPFAGLVEEAGGLDAIEALQTHENAQVYARAVALLEAHFGGEEAAADDGSAAAASAMRAALGASAAALAASAGEPAGPGGHPGGERALEPAIGAGGNFAFGMSQGAPGSEGPFAFGH